MLLGRGRESFSVNDRTISCVRTPKKTPDPIGLRTRPALSATIHVESFIANARRGTASNYPLPIRLPVAYSAFHTDASRVLRR